MSLKKFNQLTVDELVQRFVAIALAQDQANTDFDTKKYNRLFDQMVAIELELKLREGDQRRALLTLLYHPNMLVRLKAAQVTRAVAPQEARAQLQAIAATNKFPEAADAALSVERLDSGEYKPL